MLVLAFIGAVINGRDLILIMSLFGLFVTFLPLVVNKLFGFKIPGEFELITVFFIYGLLFIGEVRGLFADFWWWDVVLNFIGAVALGFVGLSVMYALYKEQKISSSPLMISMFAFTFAVAVGAMWEVVEFGVDTFLGFALQKSAFDTMKDLTVNIVGAFVVAVAGYDYIKMGKVTLVSSLVSAIVEKNPKLFRGGLIEGSSDKLKKLIEEGEHHKLEFKSTLRTNLFTNQHDKKIEHATLKTIAGYLNSNGGTLLIGVGDGGEIHGVEKDNFPSHDKFHLHFTNLVKHHIGSEYLPFINYELIDTGEKKVLKVDCKKSERHVFVKDGPEEKFYIRNGPSTAELTGSSLVDYIRNNFGVN